MRFLCGLRVAAGELFGVGVKLVGLVSAGLETGNAKVAEGEADGVAVGDVAGLITGVGVGEGGTIFSQRCNGTLAPPISLTNVSQRS